jgi:hypothetical protein
MTTVETLQALNDANAILMAARVALFNENALPVVRAKLWHASSYLEKQAADLLAE